MSKNRFPRNRVSNGPGSPRHRRGHRPGLESLERRQLLATVDWISPTSGSWDVASNWSTDTVPGPTDDVVINVSGASPIVTIGSRVESVNSITADDPLVISGGGLTLAQPSGISDGLTLSGGAITTPAPLSLSGTTQWTGGSFAGSGAITKSGTMEITTNTTLKLTPALNDSGTIDQMGTGTLSIDGATLTVEQGGNYDLQSDASIATSGNGVLTIEGTLSKSAGTGSSDLSGAIDLQGCTLDDESGTVTLLGSVAGTGATFDVAQGATINLTGGTSGNTFAGTYTGSGAGNIILASGQINIGAGGATFDFPAGMFQWTGGVINLAGNTLTNDGTLTLDTSANVALFGSGPGGSSPVGALINSGTIVQSGAGSLVLGEFSEIAQLNNEAGASYDFTNDGGIQDSNVPGIVNNAGLIEKTAGAGTSTINTVFNGSGAIDVETGTISLAPAGGTSTGGAFSIAQYAALSIAGGSGNSTFTGTYTGSGSGSVVLASGQINIGTAGATFNFPAGMFQWTGGDINLSGNTLTNDGMLTFDNSANVALFGSGTDGASPVGALINSGTIVQSGTASLVLGEFSEVAQLDNEAGASYDFSNDGSIQNSNFPGSFNNAGTIEKTGGQGESSIGLPLDNEGDVNVESGTVVLSGGAFAPGTVTVAAGAVVDLTGGQTVTYSGTLAGSGGGTVQFSSGTITVGVGGLTLDFPGSMFQWTGGGFEASGGNVSNLGTINIAGSSQKQIYADGALDDYGTIIQTGTGDLGLHSDNVSPSTLMIEPGGYYLLESDAGVNNLANRNVIDNAGMVEKTAGSGISTLAVNGPLTNTGTIEAESGTLSLDPSSFSQISGKTLAGGTWYALNGSTLAFTSGTSITSNEANIALEGQGAAIAALSGLTSNNGDLSLTSGASLSTPGDLSNTGSLTPLAAGCTLTVNGNYSAAPVPTAGESISAGSASSGQCLGQLRNHGERDAGRGGQHRARQRIQPDRG